ncbi:hypothetical protein [Planobispora longispora]|nr:hypothetical protein [Planobispora longispora]
MSLVVSASIVFRLLADVKGDDLLRQRPARRLHAPALTTPSSPGGQPMWG